VKSFRVAVLAIATALVLAGCASNQSAGELDIASTLSVTETRVAAEPTFVDQQIIDSANLDPCPQGVPRPDAAVPGLPAVTLNCLDGESEVDLSTLRGTPMVVNVWSSWCPPCVAEMPLLQQAATDLGDEVQFLGVNMQDDRESALLMLIGMGVTFPSVEDQRGDARGPLLVPGPPVTYFVTSDGVLMGRWDGQIEDRDQLSSMLAEYLGVTW
jgi:cytochrome c biogenesis protein CcmG, thiol:disulfide interchange protein DsbE